ncbi:hypothetical protein GGI19_001024 [Coemansia pectinata]|uniref:RING-type domain-containing protein n=1 Tax=Coemansia pectinata TaxID=1052879 RepID=A0A9W8H4D5_9FUNG|nr:hypothetical protein GGI19_001024 [Coemansia pectinata]
MGQAYSHWSSEHGRQPNESRQGQSTQGRAPRGNARRSGRNVRGGNGGREDSGRGGDNRYSPYTTGSRTASSAPTRANVPELAPATPTVGEGAAEEADLSSGDVGVSQTVLLDYAEPLGGGADAEQRWEQADAEMQDAAHTETLDTPTMDSVGTARARVRAGNQLLSRIVSRSVISSIAQELERRRLPSVDRDLEAEHESAYVMDFSGRLNLYYHVSVFILSVLEASIDAPSSSGSESGGESTVVENPTVTGSLQQQEVVADDGSSSGVGDDSVHGLQFRMFLLPGAIDQALAEHANAHAAVLGGETQGASGPGGNEQTSGEQRRASRLLDREEKLRRLRDIARAMHDERRGIQIPVAVLGLRMNSELRRSTRTALQNLGERIASSENAPVSNTLGIHDALRGLRNRLTSIVPGFLATGGHHRQESGGEEEAEEATTNDIQPAGEGAAAAEQPGLSVFITIHHMQLGNPLMLPMAAYALFPELVAEDTADSRGTGSNYELFMEIANILGQARSDTVSQDLVDKRLRKYHYQSDSGSPVARPIDDSLSGDIALVSADRCPVCLEDFLEGDVLRVLECHHGLHIACGDAWFTKGSNKCPICRSEAVHE